MRAVWSASAKDLLQDLKQASIQAFKSDGGARHRLAASIASFRLVSINTISRWCAELCNEFGTHGCGRGGRSCRCRSFDLLPNQRREFAFQVVFLLNEAAPFPFKSCRMDGVFRRRREIGGRRGDRDLQSARWWCRAVH